MSSNLNTEHILSKTNIKDKYARWLPEKRRKENWNEICDRVLLMHVNRFPNITDELTKAFEYVKAKRVFPSMRSLQNAGKSIELNHLKMYNCAALLITNLEVFKDLFFVLLSGVGVGYSIQKQHIEQLPPINRIKTSIIFDEKIDNRTELCIIPDDIKGWCEAVDKLISYHFGLISYKPIFIYDDLRKKGIILKVGGGKAPGPDNLKYCLELIDNKLSNMDNGHKLSALELHDIICYIADCVVSSDNRRSAMISLFSSTDTEMLECKSGNWWVENIQRTKANNSVILNREDTTREQFNLIMKKVEESKAGEPGIFWTNNNDIICNPCVEISLEKNSLCNLVEIDLSKVKTQEEFEELSKVAAFIATVQASYTKFTDFVSPKWRYQAEKFAQIGVSLTGVSDISLKIFNKLDFPKAAQVVLEINEKMSRLLGINMAVRCTTIKPSGNTSVVAGSSSGIHARHAPYYWRRMRINSESSTAKHYKQYVPFLLEDDKVNKGVSVISVAVRSPEESITRDESMLEFLERLKFLHTNWIKPGHREGDNTNNISATVSVKPDEWDILTDWMWDNRYSYNGISLLDYDGGTYQQTPFEECTEADYDDFVNKCHANGIQTVLDLLDELPEYEDNTTLQSEAACGGGKCDE